MKGKCTSRIIDKTKAVGKVGSACYPQIHGCYVAKISCYQHGGTVQPGRALLCNRPSVHQLSAPVVNLKACAVNTCPTETTFLELPRTSSLLRSCRIAFHHGLLFPLSIDIFTFTFQFKPLKFTSEISIQILLVLKKRYKKLC